MFPLNLDITYDTARLMKAPQRVHLITQVLVQEVVKDIQETVKMNIYELGLVSEKNNPNKPHMIDTVQIEEYEGYYVVFVGAPYAHFHEFGTNRMPARPFFFPAVDEVIRGIYSKAMVLFETELGRY